MSSLNEIIRYMIAGSINTAVGYGVFTYLVYILNINPFYANIISYIIALYIAFMLNKYFVFSKQNTKIKHFLLFIVSFVISFTANLFVLFVCLTILHLSPAVAQIFAMIFYTISFYIFNKFIVFNSVK